MAHPSRRPSAFEVSFPEEASTSANTRARERAAHEPVGALRPSKPPKSDVLDPGRVERFAPLPGTTPETGDLVLDGEDPFENNDKPIRLLSDFVVFDANTMHIVTLDSINNAGSEIQACGIAVAASINEQDEKENEAEHVTVPRLIRLTKILGFYFDYTKFSDPLYIETQHAWYTLEIPSTQYHPYFTTFARPRRITQFAVSYALMEPTRTLNHFLSLFTTSWDVLTGRKYRKEDLFSCVNEIRSAVESLHDDDAKLCRKSPILLELLQSNKTTGGPFQPQLLDLRIVRNHDFAVLQAEYQNPTHVTPRIASLCEGLFRETVMVVGPGPSRKQGVSKAQQELKSQQQQQRLAELVHEAHDRYKKVRRIREGRRLVGVSINNHQLSIGDSVVICAGQDGDKPCAVELPPLSNIPPNANIADYFWFGKIIHIYEDSDQFHIQWFHHSSKTVMGELCDPQELFLTSVCNDISFRFIAGKVNVHRHIPGQLPAVDTMDYYLQFSYNAEEATFLDLNGLERHTTNNQVSLDACPACTLQAMHTDREVWRDIPFGVAYGGHEYHVHDFVQIIQDADGPCSIGQITDIMSPKAKTSLRHVEPTVHVRLLGRISSVPSACHSMIKDERHLFFTDELAEVTLEDLIRPCYVLHKNSLQDYESWLSASPHHFYVTRHAPSVDGRSWSAVKTLRIQDVLCCSSCISKELSSLKASEDFDRHVKSNPLRTFDPFAGVGALGLGLEKAGYVKVTHAIEVSPSTAQTLRNNSPDTIVYNQCANIVLKYAIKQDAGLNPQVPTNIHDSRVPLQPPPKPEDIDCIASGFPCQPHSRLNMFQRADDRKSNLILNLLSWVDFLKPKFCVFENVRGFLQFSLMSLQSTRYTVAGGIETGGLKFFIRALLALGYQARFGLLQAGHYGTPQSRVRFFIIAAKHGFPLPNLPQPTHDFPSNEGLEIILPDLDNIRPIRTRRGTAPYPTVTVDDAISDLPRFDWKDPRLDKRPLEEQRKARERARSIPALNCDSSRPYVGIASAADYHHEAKTTYQMECRQRPCSRLQHFTRIMKPDVVERVVHIPLHPKADYRDLPRHMQEWQTANPSSSAARKGFAPGMYGRVDEKGFFTTTVTNMEPTAKQSWVLNPYCKRVFSVRELARSQGFPDSFTFYANNNNVKLMHRQIGNAVPWQVAKALGRELRNAMFET